MSLFEIVNEKFDNTLSIYRKRLLISACFSHAYASSLVYEVHASTKTCAYNQALTVHVRATFFFKLMSEYMYEKMHS